MFSCDPIKERAQKPKKKKPKKEPPHDIKGDMPVAFAGLPSDGISIPSTMINALSGKRVLESSVRGTTTEICLVGATNPFGRAKVGSGDTRETTTESSFAR